MGYVENNLMNGESVIYRAKLHWIIFTLPVFFFLLSLIFFINGNAGFGGFIIFIAILTGLVAFINLKTSEFVVTTKRVIVKTGLIRRDSFEVLLNKVESIGIDQSILGRIFGYGTAVVNGTGGKESYLSKISAPLEFRKHVQEQIVLIGENKSS